MAEIAKFNSRLVMKHDSSTNWEKATNFKPLAGELIIYDDVKDMKIGDGATLVNDLSFPFAKRSNGVYYVAGNTSGTAGTWTGTSEEITDYYDGLIVAYKVGVAGASITTLNINNLGAKICYLRGTTKVTTHYAVDTVVLLVYTTVDGTGRWYTADYDANSDTKVTQAYRANNENRPLLMSAGYTNENTSGSTATTSYWNPKIYGNPNSGALYASTLHEGTTKLEDKYLTLTGGTLTSNLGVEGSITAHGFIIDGGNSTQILRANGTASALTKAEIVNSLGYTPLESYTDNNTTYTFANGTNSFTVTPSGGTTQTVTVTPSITVAVTEAGTGPIVSRVTSGTNGITVEKVSLETLGLGSVYEYKGSLTWAELLALTSAQIGDVYNITDKDPNGVTGANWACYKTVTNATTSSTYSQYWDSIGGITDLTNYVTLNGTQTISGQKTFSGNNTFSGTNTFSKQIKSTVANGTAPFNITSQTVNTNLNADLLDGYHASYLLNYNNLSNLPTWYWANQLCTTTSSDSTTPTFGTGFKVNLVENGVYNAGTELAYSSPMPKYYWHDLLSFGVHTGTPTVEVSSNGGTSWTTNLDDAYRKQLFIQRESQTINIVNDTQTAIRWTWHSGNFHACNATWLIFGTTYNASAATCQCIVEHSANGTTWTTSHTSSFSFNSNPYWIYLKSPKWASTPYFRITIKRTSGAGTQASLSGIKLLTGRWGNQGGGSEFESPFEWDRNQNIYPRTTNVSTLGTSNLRWNTVYATNVDATNLFGKGSNLTDLNASNINAGTLGADYLPASGVTASSYGPSANTTLAHSGTFSVPYITVDAKGRITSASTKTYTLPGSDNTDTKVLQSYRNADETRPLLMSAAYTSSNTTGSSANASYWTSKIYGNPSTGALYATSLYGTTLYENSKKLSETYLGIDDKAADSDKLDGQDGTYYLNATNINAGTLAIARGGTGATSQAQINKNIVNALSDGSSDVTDGTMIITSYASDNGFADTNAVNTPYKRAASKFYNYIKSKTDTLYLPLTGGTLSGDLTLMASNQHNQDMFIKFKYSTTDLDDYSWRLGYLGTGQGNTNYFVIQSNGSGHAWKSVMQLGLSNHDATFAGSLTAASLNTSGTITGKGGNITELNASNISSGTLAAARLSTSGVTAGTYGTAQTPAHGGTFAIPTVTVDKYGRITSAGTVNITLPADNNTDTKVQQNKVTDTVWRKVLLSYNSGTAIDSTPSNATNISYWAAGIEVQPSTGIIKTEGYNIGGDATMSYDSTNACIRFTFS